MVGGISLNGFAALEFAQGTDASLDGGISGLGSISKTGAGTLTLNAAGFHVAGTFISGGTLVLGDAGALGSGLVSIGDATLRAAVDATLANDLRTGFGASAIIAAANGTNLTLRGGLTASANSTLTFGAAGAEGRIIADLGPVELTDLPSVGLVIAAGSVTAAGFNFNDLISNAASTTIQTGATLDLDGGLGTINNLQGAGMLANTGLTRIREGNFAGTITGLGGSLEKVGGGTLTLTGTNTYSGGTEISGGTLRIGDGGTTGTLGDGAVINDGALVFERGDALMLANAISGSGTLTQAGSGVLTLTSANSHAGGTTITAGTLALGDIGALGGGAVTITGGGLASNVTGSLGNSIEVTAGAAGRIGAASGQTLTLTGGLALQANSSLTIGSVTETGTVVASLLSLSLFSPTTLALNVAGGTLRAGNLLLNQLTQGAASVTIGAGATLDFAGFIGTIGNLQGTGTLTGTRPTQISAGDFAGVIAGTGGFDKLGAGMLTLTGANTYSGITTISGGTLRIGAGGQLSGGGVTNNGALVFARNDTVTLANAISGTGTLTQAGSGTLTLTGANTHAGLTTINAGGTLQIGNGGTSGQISGGAVLNNGALRVDRGDAVTLANAMSGTGSLTQAGLGTLTLTGANSYSGGTTIEAGTTLRVQGNGTLGGGAVANAGALVFDRSGDIALGTISGAGTLTQAGSGTLTITGDYAQSATTISAGTLRLGNGGFNLSLGSVVNQGALVFDRTDDVTHAGAISGAGSLAQLGSGTLTLTGASIYTGGTTISGGTLRIGDGGSTGAITGNVTNNAALVFNRSDDVTFAGVISGTGRLSQAGPGMLTLTAANTHAGGTTISGGILAVRGAGTLSGNSTVTVAEGGTLIYESGTNAGNNTHVVRGATNTNLAGGVLRFLGTASAGSGTYTNTSSTAFISAATNLISFEGNSTAGTATIINERGLSYWYATPTIIFRDQASMGAATLISQGGPSWQPAGNKLELRDDATAATANITLGGSFGHDTSGATLAFYDRATAAAATILVEGGSAHGNPGTVGSGGLVIFVDDSSAGTARITAQGGTGGAGGGSILFRGNQDAPLASIRMEGNARLDLSIFAGAEFRLASLSGEGQVLLGGRALRLGGTGTDMGFGGVIGADGLGGHLTKEGSGTLTLTGVNRLGAGGRVQVAEGVLRLGDGGSLGMAPIAIAAGARFGANQVGNLTLAQVISGAGALWQAGAGTTTLTGANTFSGGTTISAGTLEIGPGGGLGSGAVVNNAVLAINRPDAVTIANVISGTGALRQVGSGMTTLTGSNSHSGGTQITAGRLSVASDANLGAASGALSLTGGTLATTGSFASARAVELGAGGGTFAPQAATTLTLDGVIGGPGALAMNGAGTLWLNGANTYSGATSVNTGTLILGSGGRLSPAALSVGAGGVVDLSRMTAAGLSVASLSGQGVVAMGGRNLTITTGGTSFGGSLVDGGAGGSLTIAGGTTTLTGVNSYSGPTVITGGMLVVNGTLGASEVLVSGGLLGGTGDVPGVVVAAGGSLSPGNSIGTINLGGKLTLAAGSSTVIEVQGALADRINVAGQAMLGGALRLVPLGGPYVFNAPYTLIRAGSVSGQFASVSTEGSFGAGVTTRISSTADALELRLMPAPLLGGGGRNSQAVAAGLNAAVAGGADASPIFALYNLPASAQPQGLNLLSGEVHVAGMRAGIETSGQLAGLLLDPWRAEGQTVGAKRIWASGFGGGGRRGGDAAAGSSAVTGGGGGVAAGAEIRLGAGLVAGFALAGAGTQASLTGGLGRAESSQVHGALYGRMERGPWRLGAALTYGGADATTRRQVPYLGAGQLQGRYTSHGVGLRLEAGWAWTVQMGTAPMGLTLTPGIAFQGGWFDTPGFTEAASGPLAAAALGVSGRQSQSRLEIGLRVETPVTARLAAFGRIAWASYLQRDTAITARFTGLPGSGFTVAGARPDAQSALLSAGLDWRLSAAWSLTGRLDAEHSTNTTLLGGTARLRYAF